MFYIYVWMVFHVLGDLVPMDLRAMALLLHHGVCVGCFDRGSNDTCYHLPN
jgi:hypothetical protein